MSKVYPLKRGICKHCFHVIYWYYEDKGWHHKNYLHNDNCKCRKPEPKD